MDRDAMDPDALVHTSAKPHGLFRLHPMPGKPYNVTDFHTDIVAVHGLGGHAFKTWTDKDGHLWLRDSLPARVPNVRMMTFGYDARKLLGRSCSNIHDFAIDLITRLENERQHIEERRRPLIFICHSLGGVVFKELLSHLSLQLERGRHLLQAIFGVVFIGTPHRGTRTATPVHLLSRIINVTSMGSAAKSDLNRNLQVSSGELETISRHATELLKRLKIVSFYETKPMGPILIVEPFSAILGFPNERAIPINADHRKIAKPSPRKEQRYLPIWASIKELVDASSVAFADDNRELLDNLFCMDYNAARLRPRQPQQGTCEWIFDDLGYCAWLNSDHASMLLLTGQAGSGKSVLTRHLAERIQSGVHTDDTGTGYLGISFFCSYDEAALNSEEAVIRSLLHQLVQLNSSSAIIVRNRLEKTGNRGVSFTMQTEDLWASITEVLLMSTMSRVYLVIDAIEELGFEIATSILARFGSIIQLLNQNHGSRLRILVSSRQNLVDASARLNLTTLSMQKARVQRDIEEYLRHEIEQFATTNSAFRASTSVETRNDIATNISARGDGMFLHAVLTWGEFRKGIMWNRGIVAKKLGGLDAMPPGMTAVYDKMINELDESVRDDAFIIFSVLAATVRPLSEAEMGAVLSVCNSSSDIANSTDLEPMTDLYQMIERNLPNLITIQADNRATFVHLSFKEYLQRRPDLNDTLELGHREITRTCLLVLKLRDMLEEAHGGMNMADLCSKYPFLEYSRHHVLSHIHSIPYDDPLWLLFSETAGEKCIYSVEPPHPRSMETCSSPLMEVLQHVPAPAIFMLIRKFKKHGYDLDQRWSTRSCGRPLQHCCSQAGSDETLNEAAFLLLRLGANPSLPTEPYHTNLQRAMTSRAWDLYNTLLRHPLTDVNASNIYDRTLLHDLVIDGDIDRIGELIDVLHGVDVNVQDGAGNTPLQLAAANGMTDIVRKLINVTGIRIDLVDKQGRTPLTLATYWGMKKAALVLIEHSQAFPLPGPNQLSARICAAHHDQKDLFVKLLELALARHQDLNLHMDLAGRGVLHLAAINNWPEILVDCIGGSASTGINVNKIDHGGKTALHYAVMQGNMEACDVLVEHPGTNLRLQDRNGRTAAMAAADAGCKDVLVRLLRCGRVDANQRDVEGRSLVHWAATLDCVDVMELLADSGISRVEWARQDKHGKRPVDIAGICASKHVGLFLAERTPGWRADQPDWDFEGMYRSPSLEEVDCCPPRRPLDEDLLVKNSRRQKRTSDEEWEENQRRYPDARFGLTVVSEESLNPFKRRERESDGEEIARQEPESPPPLVLPSNYEELRRRFNP